MDAAHGSILPPVPPYEVTDQVSRTCLQYGIDNALGSPRSRCRECLQSYPLGSSPFPHSCQHPTLILHLTLLVSGLEMCPEADVALHLHNQKSLIII